ncbi:MAG TPA: phosphoglycerate kinase [Candidatus Paceibacterota bacterium]
MIKYVDELEKEDLKGKRVLLRLDLNVAVNDGQIVDDFDIQRVIPTIDFLREKGSQIIIIAHIENSNGEATTLLPVFDSLKGYFPIEFCPTYFTPESVDKLLKMDNKSVLLFENLRINRGEKENDPEFMKKLSAMGDIFVNDAFGVSHREHASIVGVPRLLPHYGGLLMRQEIEHLSQVLNPKHPFVFVLGGAKFETKLPLIKKYLDKADSVFVGGALANNIFKEKGYEVGKSFLSNGDFNLKKIINNPKLAIPEDVTVEGSDSKVEFKKPDEVSKNECIVDAGPETMKQLKALLKGAKTIVWNGPLGNYEKGFGDKTESLAEMIAAETSKGSTGIIGGGDTLATINLSKLSHKFSFVSTGGGAMLDYLVNETLPGIRALES